MSFRDKIAGLRISWQWLGVQRTVEEAFLSNFYGETEANPEATSTTKKIINPKNEHYRKLTIMRSRINDYIRSNTMPYVEKGIRLCAKDRWLEISEHIKKLRDELKTEEAALEMYRPEVLEDCQLYLGKLYNASNYPQTFLNVFDVTVQPVNLEPPGYLLELAPQEYEKAKKSLEERIETSAKLYDQLLQEQFLEMVEKLNDKLKPDEKGKKKKLAGSAMAKIQEFFQEYRQFRQLTSELRDDSVFDQWVEKTQDLLSEYDVEGVRASRKIRERLSEALEEVKAGLEKVIVVKKRKVIVPIPSKEQVSV